MVAVEVVVFGTVIFNYCPEIYALYTTHSSCSDVFPNSMEQCCVCVSEL